MRGGGVVASIQSTGGDPFASVGDLLSQIVPVVGDITPGRPVGPVGPGRPGRPLGGPIGPGRPLGGPVGPGRPLGGPVGPGRPLGGPVGPGRPLGGPVGPGRPGRPLSVDPGVMSCPLLPSPRDSIIRSASSGSPSAGTQDL